MYNLQNKIFTIKLVVRNRGSSVPSFLEDRLLFCCWTPDGALFISCGKALPFPEPSIFSISFSTMVPFYTKKQTTKTLQWWCPSDPVTPLFQRTLTSLLWRLNQSMPPILTMANDCGDNGLSNWLVGACGGAAAGGVCWLPLEIFRLAMRSSNSVAAWVRERWRETAETKWWDIILHFSSSLVWTGEKAATALDSYTLW